MLRIVSKFDDVVPAIIAPHHMRLRATSHGSNMLNGQSQFATLRLPEICDLGICQMMTRTEIQSHDCETIFSLSSRWVIHANDTSLSLDSHDRHGIIK